MFLYFGHVKPFYVTDSLRFRWIRARRQVLFAFPFFANEISEQ